MSKVEWKKLGEVCSDVIVPMRDRPKQFDGSIPWCRIEDIEGMYFNKSLSGLMVSDEIIKKMNLKVFPTGTVICSCSATLGVCAINTQPLITNQTFIGLVCSKEVLNRYIYYYMSTRKRELLSLSTTGTIPYVSREKFEKMRIPVPTLSEQNRIVGILDTFTASIDNLKEQIAQRRKQYEYYRDQLLDLEGKEGVEMKKLKETCEIRRGIRVVKKQWKDKAQYPVFQNSIAPMGYYNQFNREGNMPYIICAGSSSGSVGYCYTPFWAADDCYTIESCKQNRRYAYYALKKNNNNLFKLVRKGSMPRLPHEAIDNMIIPFPSLSEQQRIVDILDKFEASIQNLETQLAQREKQYEYYRNKLLTFE